MNAELMTCTFQFKLPCNYWIIAVWDALAVDVTH